MSGNNAGELTLEQATEVAKYLAALIKGCQGVHNVQPISGKAGVKLNYFHQGHEVRGIEVSLTSDGLQAHPGNKNHYLPKAIIGWISLSLPQAIYLHEKVEGWQDPWRVWKGVDLWQLQAAVQARH